MNFNNQFIGEELFPNKTNVNSDNNLSINGFDLTKLAEKYQTPLYVYDEDTIISTIKDKWSIDNVEVIHRTGYVYPGEISMILIIRSRHRKEAFESSNFFVDELKKTVPIWKKEFFSDGTVWINDHKVE